MDHDARLYLRLTMICGFGTGGNTVGGGSGGGLNVGATSPNWRPLQRECDRDRRVDSQQHQDCKHTVQKGSLVVVV